MQRDSSGAQASQNLLADLLLSLDPAAWNVAEPSSAASVETLSRIRELLASVASGGALDDSFVVFVEDEWLPGVRITSRWTPLTWAARQGLVPVARALLDAGADPEQMNADEEFAGTPLMWAAERGHLDVVDLLLAAGADLGLVGKELYGSPLHAAAEGGHLAIVERLLRAGADAAVVDSQKKTAAQLARGPQEAKIRAVLKAANPPHDDSGSAIRVSRHRRKIDPSQAVGTRDFIKLCGSSDWNIFGVEAAVEVVADACAERVLPVRVRRADLFNDCGHGAATQGVTSHHRRMRGHGLDAIGGDGMRRSVGRWRGRLVHRQGLTADSDRAAQAASSTSG